MSGSYSLKLKGNINNRVNPIKIGFGFQEKFVEIFGLEVSSWIH
jgi:hypothetical protein